MDVSRLNTRILQLESRNDRDFCQIIDDTKRAEALVQNRFENQSH
jgi:hypothetical protein